MKLTMEDKKCLMSMGHPESDLWQIELAQTGNNTIYTYKDKRISRKKAIELLGKKKFLSGLSRSAFHWNSYRLIDDNGTDEEGVYFDSSNMFRS